ncbi:B-4DMT family transporter [Amycolatopsis sp. NBC_01488]|uniref:B-4DMT family transporter n=1 Tax=Amycolatopsis sp. NBC_01488 TaxID=2903563 RepID=UPI002E293D9F|nr:B-4DMT family transporter [Amycolatopsis sp. NBC_01488]
MSAWVIRGLGMAVLHGVALTLLAKYAVYHPTDQTLMTSVALAVLVGAAALWSALDAWRGLPDRGRAWFIAALVTGVVSGILYVIGRAVFVDQTGVSELGGALTGGAAFSALLVLVPAGLGLFVGGRIGRPRPADEDDEEVLPPAPALSPRPRGRGRASAEEPSPQPRPRRGVRPSEEPSPQPQPRRQVRASEEPSPQPRRVRPSGDEPSPRPRRGVRPPGEESSPRPSPRLRPRSGDTRA